MPKKVWLKIKIISYTMILYFEMKKDVGGWTMGDVGPTEWAE